MRRLFLALLAVLVLGLSAAGASAAPTGNTVSAAGVTTDGETIRIDASSGPNGESPTGTVTIGETTAPVTGLTVEGRFATVRYSEGPGTPVGGGGVDVVDDPDLVRFYRCCTSTAIGLRSGSITVEDATPPPGPQATTDSVVGSAAVVGPTRSSKPFRFDVTSEPDGGRATGTVVNELSIGGGPLLHYEGSVTCLRISGNAAIIGVEFDPLRSYREAFLSFPREPLPASTAIFTVVDLPGSDTVVKRAEVTAEVARSCTFTDFSGRVAFSQTGGVTVSDATAPPAPTGPAGKADCKKGGFARFGYRNQGACVSAVARRARSVAGAGS